MIKLQNDFTTKQQSEKLLALGMPRLSANFYYDDENEVQIVRDPEFELQSKGYFPCWSVGRLIEICLSVFETHYCAPKAIKITTASLYGAGLIEDCVRKLEELHESYIVDFSKLEE